LILDFVFFSHSKVSFFLYDLCIAVKFSVHDRPEATVREQLFLLLGQHRLSAMSTGLSAAFDMKSSEKLLRSKHRTTIIMTAQKHDIDFCLRVLRAFLRQLHIVPDYT
jgi:hypothetical protein